VEFFVEKLADFLLKKDISYSFEPFLFNTPEHLRLQNCKEVYVFWGEQHHKIQICFNLFISDSQGLSPYKMAFGGIEGVHTLHYEHFLAFIHFILDFCSEKLLHNLKITSYPFSYKPQVSHVVSQILLSKGFSISKSELTHYVDVNQQSFLKKIHLSEKRKLKKCQQAGFVFEQLVDVDTNFVYQFVADCRNRKGFPVSMPLEDFERTLESFKEHYLVFAVKHQDMIVALTAVVLINKDILYNFYPADHPDYLLYSPTVFLVNGLYNFCQQQNIKILDLGISTDHNLPNLGLIRFKENLSSQSALKLSFYKEFEA